MFPQNDMDEHFQIESFNLLKLGNHEELHCLQRLQSTALPNYLQFLITLKNQKNPKPIRENAKFDILAQTLCHTAECVVVENNTFV